MLNAQYDVDSRSILTEMEAVSIWVVLHLCSHGKREFPGVHGKGALHFFFPMFQAPFDIALHGQASRDLCFSIEHGEELAHVEVIVGPEGKLAFYDARAGSTKAVMLRTAVITYDSRCIC
jgi:hypothetical protein